MKQFDFEAYEEDGKLRTGTIAAKDEPEALSKLKAKGLMAYQIEESKTLPKTISKVAKKNLSNELVKAGRAEIKNGDKNLPVDQSSSTFHYSDIYSSLLEISGTLLVSASAFVLIWAIVFSINNKSWEIFLSGIIGAISLSLAGFWSLALGEILRGFVSICKSSEKTTNILFAIHSRIITIEENMPKLPESNDLP